MSRPLRLLLTIILVLLLLVGAGLGAVAALLGTEAGTRFLAGQVRKLTGNEVQWSSLEGTLLGPLRLRELRLEQDGLALSVDQLHVAWQPRALLRGLVRVETLAGSGIRLQLPPAADSPDSPPFNPEDVALPLAVDLADLKLSDLQVSASGEPPVDIETIELAARLAGRRIEVRHFTIRLPQGGVRLSASTELAATMPLALEASWDWVLDPGGTGGDKQAGEAAPLSGELRLNGSLGWAGRTDFALDYRLAAEGLEALVGELPSRLALEGSASGAWSGDALTVEAFTLSVPETPLSLSLAGRLNKLDTAEPVADLSLQWQALSWPLLSQPADVTSAHGRASLQGDLSDYRIELAADVGGPAIPRGDWSLEGRGSAGQLEVEALEGRVIGGQLSVAGDIRWEPALSWQLSVDGSGLEPGQLQPGLQGTLAVFLQTDGEIDADGNARIDLQLRELRGEVADLPLRATAHAKVDGETIRLEAAGVESGGNTLQASGDIAADRLAVDWQLDMSRPESLLEGASGTLAASGSVTGSRENPRLQAELNGRELRLDSYGVDALRASLSAGLGPAEPLQLDLELGRVVDGEKPLLASLAVRASGTTAKHRLGADLAAEGITLSARLDGGPGDTLSAWQGRLVGLDLDASDFGQWTLAGAADLSVAAERASLGEICMRPTTGAAHACAAGNWNSAASSEIRTRVHELPLALFAPAITGAIGGGLDARLGPGGELRADGEFSLGGGEVRLDDNRSLAHGGGQLALRIDDDGLLSRLRLAAPAQGSIEAVAGLPSLNTLPMADDQPLTGSLKAELPDLSWLAAWVPELGRSAGRLTADLELGGSLTDPRLAGALALQDGAATVPIAGLEFRDIRLQVTSESSRPGQLALAGGMRSGPGQLTLEGEADLNDGSMDLKVTGESLQVYNTPDARALLSPDLQVAWREQTLQLRGQVTVPQADITPQIRLGPAAQGAPDTAEDPGQAITPSPDVVVISETLEVDTGDRVPAAPVRIDSRLRVQMGDKVRIRAPGFVSRISGAVDFTNAPEQDTLVPVANGRFSIEEGTFRAFGQDLEIETGHLIFADVPATEPEVNLRAVRWIDNDPQVTAAGVLVTGPLDQPVLELFSRPQLETSEIQSYLLTGRSPRSRDAVLGIGTYVSRQVYVGYGFNMLENTSEFNSLFNISPRYGLGSSVGEADNNINLTITYEH